METKNDQQLQEFYKPLLKNVKKANITSSQCEKNDKTFNNNNININGKNKENTDLRRNPSNYSILPICEVTQGSVDVWASLPDQIRQDPSFKSFWLEHQRIHGGNEIFDEPDPLPSEDESEHEDDSKYIAISVADGNIKKEQLSDGDNIIKLTEFHQNVESPNGTDESAPKTSHKIFNNIKIGLLVAVWIVITGVLLSKDEKRLTNNHLSIPAHQNKSYIMDLKPPASRVGVILHGAFTDENSNTSNFLFVHIELIHTHFSESSPFHSGNLSSDPDNSLTNSGMPSIEYEKRFLKLPIVERIDDIDKTTAVKNSHTFYLDPIFFEHIEQNDTILQFRISSNLPISFPINFSYDPMPLDKSSGFIYAGIILFGLYVMIIWEVVHRTFAAMIASSTAIAVLALMNERPTMVKLVTWIDVETLLLLFAMMVLVGIFSETGLFDYLAVYAFKITNGKIWPLIYCICLFTAITSSCLDNVTTILMMAPVAIRLCEVLQLNPAPILMFMTIFSNIGGAMTPVGDPPNVIIASNQKVIESGINFMNFTVHMSGGIMLVIIQTCLQLRWMYRNINDLRGSEPQEIQELRNEITVWQRTAAQLSPYSKDEDLVRGTVLKKVNRLQRQLKKNLESDSILEGSYEQTLEDLQKKYQIRNWPLLTKSIIALVFDMVIFFMHASPEVQRLSLGWTALMGTVLLLILIDRTDLEAILARVEWSALLFFAALFVLIESLAELGLIEWIGIQIESIILAVNMEYRLGVAVLMILWMSAIVSAFVDNIPLTTMMIKVVISMAEKRVLNLSLQPLVWALAFGGCLGGNGTLIGASANVVCAGVAEKHGYRFTFNEFFKVGFPVMVGNVVVATAYLMVCHVCFAWH